MDGQLLVLLDHSFLDYIKHHVRLNDASITQRDELILRVFVAKSIGIGKEDVGSLLVSTLGHNWGHYHTRSRIQHERAVKTASTIVA